MADVMNSLFGMTPESIQRQRDNELQARALQFAKLDPQQAAQMAFYTAGSRLGDAGAGLLGAKDPEMMRLQQRQGTMQGLDLTDPASLKQGIQMAMQNNDFELVSDLSNRYDAATKNALNTRVQESVITKNQRERAAADPFQKLLEAGKHKISSLKKYKETGDVGDLELKDSDAKTQVVDTADGQLLINSATGEIIANVGKKPVKAGIGSEIAAGLSPIMGVIAKSQAQKSAEAGGTDVGKQTAAIEGKYTALNSVDDALDVLQKGIYAGGYGPLQESVAKYSMGTLADKQRLVNTEQFRAYIGDVVIPRLTEFGGNDSVEELKYLKSVMAGETTMESKSIEKILGKAKQKIQRGITRIQEQQKAIGEGRQLPTGPAGGSKAQQRTTKSGVTYSVEGE